MTGLADQLIWPLPSNKVVLGIVQRTIGYDFSVGTVAMPAFPTPGNFFVLMGQTFDTLGGAGWTQIATGAASSVDVAKIFVRKVTASDANSKTVNISNPAGSRSTFTLWEISGLTSDPVANAPDVICKSDSDTLGWGSPETRTYTTTVPKVLALQQVGERMSVVQTPPLLAGSMTADQTEITAISNRSSANAYGLFPVLGTVINQQATIHAGADSIGWCSIFLH